jgi:nicotinate-nucleotide--dimethylbenzimidazole phosphoribosyltransferase
MLAAAELARITAPDLPSTEAPEAAAPRPPHHGSWGTIAHALAWAGGVHGLRPFAATRCLLLTPTEAGDAVRATREAMELLADRHGVGLRAVPLPDPADRMDAREGVNLGRRLVDEEVDQGTDLLIAALTSDEAVVPAMAVTAVLTGVEPVTAVGFDAAIADDAWIARCSAVRDAVRHLRGGPLDPLRLLGECRDPSLAILVGVLLQAALRRTPVLLDGPTTAAAALLAREVSFEAAWWWLPLQENGSATAEIALSTAARLPVLPLQIRLSDGGGTLLAFPLLQSALAVAEQAATSE